MPIALEILCGFIIGVCGMIFLLCKGHIILDFIFEHAFLMITILFFSVMALLCYTIISKNKVNMTISEARREYRKEIIEAYHQGWVDGFDAFINRAVTTDMVQMQYEADKNKYLEHKEVSHE